MRSENSLSKINSILNWPHCRFSFSKLVIILSVITLTTGCKGNLSGALSDTETQLTVNGITLTSKSILQTAENGGSDSFSIVLESPPASEVIISLQSSNTQEGNLSQNSLSFDKDNWNTKQTISVTGVDDTIQDGDGAYEVIFNPTTSSDPDYNDVSLQNIPVLNSDDDISSVNLGIAGTGLNVSEDGTSDTYTISLSSEPASDVTITIAPGTQITTDQSSIIFTSSNWNTPQTITVMAIDDSVFEGNHADTISHAVSSADPNYNGVAVNNANVNITENDSAPQIAIADISISESTPSVTLNVSLTGNSAVASSVQFSTENISAIEGSDYTAASGTLNWNAGDTSVKTITINLLDDSVVEANETFRVRLSNEVNAGLSNTAAIVTINNDDSPPSFAGISSAAPISGTQIDLSWSSATDDSSASGNIIYRIYQATASGGQNFASPSYTTLPGATSYSVTGLADSTNYFFVVRAEDEAGNIETNTVEQNATTLDTTPPTVAIGASSQTDVNSTGSVNYSITYTGATTINLINTNVTLNTTGGATCSTISVSNGTTANPTVTLSNCTGDGTVAITIAAATSSDAAGNTDTGAGPSTTFNVDNAPPSVAIGAPSQTGVNSTGSVNYSITYTGATTINLINTNVTLNTTGGATCSTISVSNGATANPTVTLSSCTGDGTVAITIAAATSSDAAGNTDTGAGPSTTFNVDNAPPSVAIGAPSQTSVSSAGSVNYSITYTGATTINLTNTDVTLNTTGGATCSTISVSNGATANPTVALSNCTGDGTVAITIAAATSSDTAGNTDTGAGPSTTFNVDNAPPSVAIGAPSQTSVSSAGSVNYSITYTGATTINLTNTDVTLNTTGGATCSTISVSNGATANPTVTLSNCTGDGTVAITIAAATSSDTAGNTDTGAGPGTTFSVDNAPPSVAIGAPSSTDVNSTGSVNYPITYTGATTVNLLVGNITLNTTGGATCSTISISNATTANPTVTLSSCTGDGTVAITIAAATSSDAAGNTDTGAGPSTTFNVDNAPPTMTITFPINSTNVLGTDIITYLQSEITNAQVSVDGGTNWTNAQSEVTTLADIPEYLALADGAYTLSLRGTDPAGNTSANATINFTKNEAGFGPYITSAEYFDTDNNGRIDHLKITFSKTMTDSSFDGYNSAGTPNNQLHNPTTAWQIAGYSNVRLDTRDSIDGAGGENDKVIWLAFDDIGSGGDTGAKPDLTAQDSTFVDNSSGCFINTNPANCGNNLIADVNTADAIEVDKSRPIITSISGTAGSATLKIYFSEAVDTLSGDGGCVTPVNNLSPGDFAFADNNSGFASSILNLTSDSNGCDDSMIIATLNANLSSGDIGTDSINPVLNEIYDPADNTANETISVLIQNPMNTLMVITQNAITVSNATLVSDGTEIFDYGTLDFGSTASGDKFPIKKITFKVENGSGAADDLILTGNPVIMSDLPSFMITKKPTDTSIPPGSFQEFEIAFAPLAAGSYNGTITIPSNDPNHPYTFKVNGSSTTPVKNLVLGTDYTTENIVAPKDINWYFIDTYKGSTYQIQWGDNPDPGGYAADIIVDIYNTDFTSQLLNFGDSGFKNPFTFTAKDSGRVYISAYEYYDSTGDYQVKADEMIKFSPPPGAYDTAQQVNLSFGNPAATIYYTINGADPTNGDTPYTGPIAVATGSNLRARAYIGATPASPVNSGYYAIPVFITLGADNNDSLLAGEEKWYYFDATAGTSYEIVWENTSSKYNDSAFTANVVVSGYRENQTQSFFVDENYGFTPPQIIKADAIERIYIKVKGYDPTVTGSFNLRASVFSPVQLTSGTPVSNNLTAGRNDWYYSDQLQDTIVKFQWEDTLDQAASAYTADIMVTAYSDNSSLFYLIDKDSGYTTPFSYYTDTDGKLFTQIRGWNSTDTGNYQFTLDEAVRLLPKPGPFETNVNVSMSHPVTGVTIYYTTDGSLPTTASTVYSGPVTISSDTTVMALADNGGGYSSPIYTEDYYLLNPLGALPATVSADTILDAKERWFYFDATVGTNYTISWNDADDMAPPPGAWADIVVSAYKSDIKTGYFENANASQSESITATETGRIYIKVSDYLSAGGNDYNLNVTSP